MTKRTSIALLAFAGLAVVLLLVGCGSGSASTSTIGDRLVATHGVFEQMPLTADDAVQAGWIDTGACVPNMGRHFIRMAGERPGPLTLLYSSGGDITGVELDSLTEQATPPWEHLPEGHPGMEIEHWTIHMYFADPAGACGF